MQSDLNLFVQHIIKAVKNRKLYDKTSAHTIEFIDRAYTFLLAAQEELGPVILVINEDKIMHSADILYEDPKRITSLPLFLYRNGIRSFTFLEGITKEKLTDFVELLGKKEYTSNIGLVEDLWGMKFENIIYHAVEEIGRVDSGSLQSIVEERRKELGVSSKDLYVFPVSFGRVSVSLPELENSTFTYIPKIQIKRKNASTLLLNSIQDLLGFERSPKKRMRILTLFQSSVDRFISTGNVPLLVKSKKLLEHLLEEEKGKEERKVLYEIYDSFSREDAVQLYLHALSLAKDKKVKQQALSLLGFIGVDIIDDLMNELEIATDMETREAMISLLEGIFSSHREKLAKYLESTTGGTFQILLSIVKRSRDPYFIPYLETLLEKRGLNKIKEVLFSLLPREKMVKYIEELDPLIRILALKGMKEIWGEKEFSIISRRIKSKEFWILPIEERKILLNLLSTLNMPETIEILKYVLKKKHLFKQSVYETKKFAVKSLSKIGSEEAISLVSRYRKSKYLKETVERILEYHGAH